MARGEQKRIITLHYAKPREIGGRLAIDVDAVVSQGGEGIKGVEVVFYQNLVKDNEGETDEFGHVPHTHFVPKGTQAVDIAIEIKGTTIRSPKTIELTEKKSSASKGIGLAKPSFRVAAGGADDQIARYLISDFLVKDDGSPAENEMVEFAASYHGKPIYAIKEDRMRKSGPSGYVAFEIAFTEPECDIAINGRGFQQDIENLLGPSRHREPLKWERPPEHVRRMGARGIWRWMRERIAAHKDKRPLRHFCGPLRHPTWIEVNAASFVARVVSAFATDNNCWLWIAWMLVWTHLFCNIIFLGAGPAVEPSYHNLSEIAKEVIRELRPDLLALKDSFTAFFRFWSWVLWPVGFLGASILTPYALGDEWERAKRVAWRTIYEKRGGEATETETDYTLETNAVRRARTAQSTKNPLQWGELGTFITAFIREITATIFAVLVTH